MKTRWATNAPARHSGEPGSESFCPSGLPVFREYVKPVFTSFGLDATSVWFLCRGRPPPQGHSLLRNISFRLRIVRAGSVGSAGVCPRVRAHVGAAAPPPSPTVTVNKPPADFRSRALGLIHARVGRLLEPPLLSVLWAPACETAP